MEYRVKRLAIMGPWYGRALVALAWAFPLGVTTWLLQPFAGQTTKLSISVVASVSITANGAMYLAMRRQRNAMDAQSAELNRLRGRLDTKDAEEVPMLKGKKRGR
jgi:hypothetical protein